MRLHRSAEGTLRVASGVARGPMSVAVDAAGAPVASGRSSAQGPPVDGLLDRVGDPVPVRVGTGAWPAEHLVADVVADTAAAVADEASQLVLVVPDEWRDHRRTALRGAVATITGLPVVTIGGASGLLGAGAQASGPVLVVAADAELRAHVCTHGDDGWQVQRIGRSDWGAHDVDDAVLDFVRARSSSTQWEDSVAVRAACTSARAELARRTATEVELPGGESVRVVRADLELVAGEMTGDAVDQLLTDVAGTDGDDRATRVLLTGALAALPMLVEVVSAATGAAVEHVTDVDAFERYAATAAAASAAAADPHEDVDASDDEQTVVMTTPAVRALPHTSRRRRSVIAVAASLVAAASVASMTVTDAGEAALLALVDGTVPRSAGSDSAMGSLADAATMPPLPWSGDSDDEQNVENALDPETAADTGDGESTGTSEGSDGHQEGPSPRSTADGDPSADSGSDTRDDAGDGDGGTDDDTERTSSPDSPDGSTSSTDRAGDATPSTSPDSSTTVPEPDSAVSDASDPTSAPPTPTPAPPTPTPTPDDPTPTSEPTTTDEPEPTGTGSDPGEPPTSEDPSTSTTAPTAAETSTSQSSSSSQQPSPTESNAA